MFASDLPLSASKTNRVPPILVSSMKTTLPHPTIYNEVLRESLEERDGHSDRIGCR